MPIFATESVVIHKYIDDKGVLHLTTQKPPTATAQILYSRSYVIQFYEPSEHMGLPLLPTITTRSSQYDSFINASALRYQLAPALIHAVIKVESNYNPNAVSAKGAKGLMQLMPATAKRYGVTDRSDPEQNIAAGTQYLSELFKQFNYDLRLTLAAYNAGAGAVKKYAGIPPYAETQAYVDKVLQHYRVWE